MVWLGSQGEGGAGRWMDCAVSELRARNGRGRIPQSGGGRTGIVGAIGGGCRLFGVVPRSMYCNVTQRLVPVPCLSLSLSVVVRCRRDLFSVAGGPTPGLRLGRVEAGGLSCGGDQTGLDYLYVLYVRELRWKDGEESPAEEWMTASVVGSAVRYQSVAGGKDGSPWAGGGDQRQRRRIQCLLAVWACVLLLCKLPCLWWNLGKDKRLGRCDGAAKWRLRMGVSAVVHVPRSGGRSYRLGK